MRKNERLIREHWCGAVTVNLIVEDKKTKMALYFVLVAFRNHQEIEPTINYLLVVGEDIIRVNKQDLLQTILTIKLIGEKQ